MELIIPYLMALIGFFFINTDRSNRIVTVLFVFFLTVNILCNEFIPVGPEIYLVELVIITGFFLAVTLCISALRINVTMMILVVCTLGAAIAIMGIVAFLAYTYKADNVYAFVYDSIIQLAVLQYAALWVNDDRRINIRAYYDNIKLYFYNMAMRVLYR